MIAKIRDYLPVLKQAIAEARTAGFAAEVESAAGCGIHHVLGDVSAAWPGDQAILEGDSQALAASGQGKTGSLSDGNGTGVSRLARTDGASKKETKRVSIAIVSGCHDENEKDQFGQVSAKKIT